MCLFKHFLRIITVFFVLAACGDAQGGTYKESGRVRPKLPIVFHPAYDISFFGFEKLHPLDAKKYGKIYHYLLTQGLTPEQFYTPHRAISDHELCKVHTQRYLDSLSYSSVVAHIVEMPLLRWIPNFIVQSKLLTPMRYATSGTIMAVDCALKYGWAINLSGGYHHARADSGAGFCVFADIPLAIRIYHEQHPQGKVLIVDLDAHQGDGHERSCNGNGHIAIYDVYNKNIFPLDYVARRYITFNYPVATGITDGDYMGLIKRTLPNALDEFKPDLIIYNAGSDIFAGDPLGRMKISGRGIIERDTFVFSCAQERKIPIAMVLSGGYTKAGTTIICQSIHALLRMKKAL